jgi:hypothetical protein
LEGTNKGEGSSRDDDRRIREAADDSGKHITSNPSHHWEKNIFSLVITRNPYLCNFSRKKKSRNRVSTHTSIELAKKAGRQSRELDGDEIVPFYSKEECHSKLCKVFFLFL